MVLQMGFAVLGAVIDDDNDDDDWAWEGSSGLAGCQIGDSRDSRGFLHWQLFEVVTLTASRTPRNKVM